MAATTRTMQTVTLVDGATYDLPYADLFPHLSDDQFEALRESIREHGIMVAVLYNREGGIIDGQHRFKAAAAEGLTLEQVPMELFTGTKEQELQLAFGLNLNRRHLDSASRLKMVARMMELGISQRKIAKVAGVNERTVRRDVAELVQSAAIAAPEQAVPDESRPQRILEARDAGRTIRDIAASEGLAVGTVHAILNPSAPSTHAERATDKLLGVHGSPERLGASTRPAAPEPGEEQEEDRACEDCGFTLFDDEEGPRCQTCLIDGDEAEPKPEPQPETAAPTERPKTEWQLKFEREQAETAAMVARIKAKKISSDSWHLVLDEEKLVGLATRGCAPGQGYPNGITAHVILECGGSQVDYSLRGGDWPTFDTLLAIRERIARILIDPSDFLRRENRDKPSLVNQIVSRDRAEKDTEKPARPKGPNPHNDLDFNSYKAKHDDLITDSLWLFDARAKGPGRNGAGYHGNCIPQVPDQIIQRFTHAGGLVLDPFLGSGTTMVEAVRLGRQFVGFDVQTKVVEDARQHLAALDNPHGVDVALFQGDASGALLSHQVKLELERRQLAGAQLCFLHPPYWNIVEFTEGLDPRDLSSAPTLAAFLSSWQKVVWRMSQLVAPSGHLAVVIGDIPEGIYWTPLAFRCLEAVEKLGCFRLLALNIKNVENNERSKKNAGLWRYRSLWHGTSVFKHEYVMIFRKAAEPALVPDSEEDEL